MICTRLIGWMVVALVCTPAWAINKCIGPDGKAVFQDRPCADSGTSATKQLSPVTSVAKTARPPMGDAAYEKQRDEERTRIIDSWAKEQGRRLASNAAAESAKCGTRGSEPYVGAPARWITECSSWGAPHRVIRTTTATGETQMWSYGRRGSLFIGADGLVTLMQQ